MKMNEIKLKVKKNEQIFKTENHKKIKLKISKNLQEKSKRKL